MSEILHLPVLLPALSLHALYNGRTQTLKLAAQGETKFTVTNIRFNRVPLLGGLMFKLEGIPGEPSDIVIPYFHEQSIQPIFRPGDEVTIMTANHPNGIAVPIWRNMIDTEEPVKTLKTTAMQTTATKSGQTNSMLQVPNPFDHIIIAEVGKPFSIQESANVPKGGSISIDFDETVFRLTTSGIRDGNIVWTIIPLRMGGSAEIVVWVAGGIADYVYPIYYYVNRFQASEGQPLAPADEPQSTTATQNASAIATKSMASLKAAATIEADWKPKPPAILTFLGFVSDGERYVRATYPEAKLTSVRANPIMKVAVPDAKQLNQLHCTFKIKDGVATIDSEEWGVWGPIVVAPYTRLGNTPFDIADVKIDITKAVERMRAQDIKEKMFQAVLEKVVIKPATAALDDIHPHYVFNMEDGAWVFVDAVNGKVDRYQYNADKASATDAGATNGAAVNGVQTAPTATYTNGINGTDSSLLPRPNLVGIAA